MYGFHKLRPHKHEKPPMVPPIYKLPPVRFAPRFPSPPVPKPLADRQADRPAEESALARGTRERLSGV
jgi:hypothetical protein